MKARDSGSTLTWLTCYDYSLATALNNTELDMILVGDRKSDGSPRLC